MTIQYKKFIAACQQIENAFNNARPANNATNAAIQALIADTDERRSGLYVRFMKRNFRWRTSTSRAFYFFMYLH